MADIQELISADAVQRALEQAGSIMARPEKPQWRKDSPLMDLILEGIDKLVAAANPIENIGGPAQAVLGPIGRTASKAANLAQKKMAKGIFRADPELLAAVQSDPRMLMFHGSGANPRALASFRETMGGRGGEILADPSLLRGAQGNVWANVPEVMRHETTHFLRRPSLESAYSGAQSPAEIQEMIKILEPYLGPVAVGGVRSGINRTANPAVGLDEALAYLSSPMTRRIENPEIGTKLAELLKVRSAGQGATRGVGISPESLRMATQQVDPAEKGLMDYIMSAFGGGR